MTFYLKPPSGLIQAEKFEKIAECRLRFLLLLTNSPKNESLQKVLHKFCTTSSAAAQPQLVQLDSLMQGTAKERVGHFALRISALANSDLHRLVLDGERLLFEKRLQIMSPKMVEQSLKQLERFLRDYVPYFKNNYATTSAQIQHFANFLDSTYELISQILSRKLLRCYKPNKHGSQANNHCWSLCSIHGDAYVLNVPFSDVPELIKKHQVSLSDGFAQLTCPDLPDYFSIIFARIVECSSFTMRQSPALRKCLAEDSRFLQMQRNLNSIFQSYNFFPTAAAAVGGSRRSTTAAAAAWKSSLRLLPLNHTSLITLSTLDFESAQYFPPCMRNYYTTLRREHRLPHDSRFRFTLFLKDIGFSVDDCINLLKHEYSKSAATDGNCSTAGAGPSPRPSPSKCTHSWTKDRSRYIYGTRHMYGLEGVRKNYSSHSCQTMIEDTKSGSCGDGGCPFVNCHENPTFLKNLEVDLEAEQLIENTHVPEFLTNLKTDPNILPIESCHVFLNFKKQKLLSFSNTQTYTQKTTQQAQISGTSAAAVASAVVLHKYFSKPSHFYVKLKNYENKD